MKKKLKVKKAFSGSMMKAATAQGRRVIKPGFLGLPPRPPGTVPGSGGGPMPRPITNFGGPRPRPSTIINPVRPGTVINPVRGPGFTGNPRPGIQQPQPSQDFTPLSGLGNPISQGVAQQTGFGLGPRENNLGPMQGVGDPRLGAATIPGNSLQMQMRGPQQAAPVQPVPAMKKGGVVRGGRAEIKGTRPAKLS